MLVRDYSNNPNAELAGWEKVRPVRIVYLVEQGEHADLILDEVFAACYGRWGGRFSLIVPCIDGRITSEYWPWLEVFDPDIVYSYVNLSHLEVLEVHERLVPADYIFHSMKRVDGTVSALDLRPRLNFITLSSLSTIFRLGRHSPAGNGPKLKIVDSWHTESASRLLTDNLGIYRASAATGLYPNDAQATAGLMTIVSDENFENRRNGVPRDLDRIPHEYRAFSEFLNRQVTSVSMLSSLYASRVEVSDHRWGGAFNLVIGASFEDRLLFWNARLLTPTWLDGDLSCFRVTLADLEDDDFVQLLAQLINSRNRGGGNGGQAQLRIRSASHSQEQLASVLGRLSAARLWSPTTVEVVNGGHVIPSNDALRGAREMSHTMDSMFRAVEWRRFGWVAPLARPHGSIPDHLKDAPSGQIFTLGCWAVDLSFAYAGESTRFTDRNIWMLPKRWRMAAAFEAKFLTRGYQNQSPSLSRTNSSGNLTVFAGTNKVLDSIAVPTVDEAMYQALCREPAIRQRGADDPPWPQQKAKWVRPSNEANYFVGVLGMAGGLNGANRLLLHPFLQKTFADLGGTPNLADADIRSTAEALAKRVGRRSSFDLHQDEERNALAALIVKAAQSVKAPKMYVALEVLRKRWEEYRQAYWVKRQDEIYGNDESDEWEDLEKKAIDNSLRELRMRRMIFQGYPWKCNACQHRNWTDFQALRPSLACEVCSTEVDLPVGVPWYFRPNEFLIESLRSHSVLSLVWLLTALRQRARTSFLYSAPTCFGYVREDEKPDAEADLLAVVDGEAILCEIKSAWRSLRSVHLTDFVALAKRLRPDRAILAVMEKGRRLDAEIDAAERELKEADITFELLTPANFQVDDDPFLLG